MTATMQLSQEQVVLAREAADLAARDAGVQVSLATAPEDVHGVVGVLSQLWRLPGGAPPVEANLLRALVFAGSYVSVARADGQPVAACVSFLADASEPHLHSHIAGVLPGAASRGVGRAVKLHQRAWALGAGIRTIIWTYDPLIARNAHFNLNRLGAQAVSFVPNFYGSMRDGRNEGFASDRIVVEWPLLGERVIALAGGARTAGKRATEQSTTPDAAWVRETAGVLTVTPVRPSDATVSLVPVPADVERMRAEDPWSAAAWQEAVREALLAATTTGEWHIAGFDTGHGYLLEVKA